MTARRIHPGHASGGFSMLPDWLLARAELSDGDKLCYARLARYAVQDGVARPAVPTLAQALGASVRQVQRYLVRLVAVGLVEVERQVAQDGQHANRYYFLAHEWMTASPPPGVMDVTGPPTEPPSRESSGDPPAPQAAPDPVTPASPPGDSRDTGPVTPASPPPCQPRHPPGDIRDTQKRQGEETRRRDNQKTLFSVGEADRPRRDSVRVRGMRLEPTPDERAVFDHWVAAMGKVPARTVFSDERIAPVRGRLAAGFTVADLKRAVDGCASDPFSMGENDRHTPFNDLELICRDAKHVEKFIAIAERRARPPAAVDVRRGYLNAAPRAQFEAELAEMRAQKVAAR